MYKLQDLNHKHILVKADIRKPPIDEKLTEDWFRRMVHAVGMKVVIEPRAVNLPTPGNEGITGVVTIETSHAAMHVWQMTSPPFLQFDLYSCKDFDSNTVIQCLMEFDPISYEIMVIDRNDSDGRGFRVIQHEKVHL